MFLHYNDDKFKKIIDEFILSSSDNESIKYILPNIDFEAFKLGISFYQMIFTLIQKNAILNRKSLSDK
jgi:dsDNA-specific endonuclease/ATPase MutS2